ncbi:MAG: hypothetical protein OXR66_00115 [Candidatus Woesearchaeota archaeon]|nr:hypothetical protein [Candidatus Woesearchaeota archaeon]
MKGHPPRTILRPRRIDTDMPELGQVEPETFTSVPIGATDYDIGVTALQHVFQLEAVQERYRAIDTVLNEGNDTSAIEEIGRTMREQHGYMFPQSAEATVCDELAAAVCDRAQRTTPYVQRMHEGAQLLVLGGFATLAGATIDALASMTTPYDGNITTAALGTAGVLLSATHMPDFRYRTQLATPERL